MEPFVVNRITFEYTRLVGVNEQFNPSIKTYDAKLLAQRERLDLVCFAVPKNRDMALCKIMDYGKWKYHHDKEIKRQLRESKKETKEIRLSPNIGEHDISHKVKQAKEFLERGDHVILEMVLTGRQKQFFDLANIKMNEIVSMFGNSGKEVTRKRSNDTIVVHLSKLGGQD
jgi:translation initiation factor IF-3